MGSTAIDRLVLQVSEQETAAEKKAKSDIIEGKRRKAALRQGLSSTIYASGLGDTSQPSTQKKTLLGE